MLATEDVKLRFPPMFASPASPDNVILEPTVTVLVDLSNVNPPVAFDVLLSLNTTSVFAPGALVEPLTLACSVPPTHKLPPIPTPPTTVKAPVVFDVLTVVSVIDT